MQQRGFWVQLHLPVDELREGGRVRQHQLAAPDRSHRILGVFSEHDNFIEYSRFVGCACGLSIYIESVIPEDLDGLGLALLSELRDQFLGTLSDLAGVDSAHHAAVERILPRLDDSVEAVLDLGAVLNVVEFAQGGLAHKVNLFDCVFDLPRLVFGHRQPGHVTEDLDILIQLLQVVVASHLFGGLVLHGVFAHAFVVGDIL